MEGAKKRLESLDVLRGLDMFILVMVSAVVNGLYRTGDCPWLRYLSDVQLHHSEWEGFTLWDLLMPLFIFTAGAAIPFAFAKYREEGRSDAKIYFRIGRRFVVLWIFGMISQGRLLNLIPSQFGFLCNTLQCIAVAYAVSAVLYLNTKPRTQIIVAVCLILAYWAVMTFVKVGPYGGGDFSKQYNMADYIGGRINEATHLKSLGAWYLGMLDMVAIALAGTLSGEIIRREDRTGAQKSIFMACCGAIMIVAALIWSIQMPIIKHIWTGTFSLLATGISYLMFAGLYYCIDVRGWEKGWRFLLPFGMNAILIYMIRSVVFLNDYNPSAPLLFGLQNYVTPQWYVCILSLADKALLWWLLVYCYRHKIFLKV